jgi:hypothetical protein
MSRSSRVFQFVLRAYPRAFRLEYGLEMTQLFHDCDRDSQIGRSIDRARFWLHMILDVIRTAPLERWEALGKDRTIMKNLKTNALGLLVCLVVIVLAFLLLGYGRRHEVASILLLGHALDAIVTAGVIGNLIIFALFSFTHFSRFRTALWSLLLVNGSLLLIATILGSVVDPQFSFAKVFLGYLVSFLLWLSIHWIWSQTGTPSEPVA